MANPIIKVKRTDTVGKVPAVSDLAPGQLGYNIADRKIYARHDDPLGGVVQIAASPVHTHSISEVTNLSTTLDGKIGKNSSDASPVSTIRCLTQAEYDALGTYDPQTLYFIK